MIEGNAEKDQACAMTSSSLLRASLALTWTLAACADGNGVGGGDGGHGGSGGSDAPECDTDEDCRELNDADGYACDSDGQCYQCAHEDPDQRPIPTPEFWTPNELVAGQDLGLDDQLAYWAVPLGEYGAEVQPTQPVSVCSPLTVENGEVLEAGSECKRLAPDEFVNDGASLIVPVAPSEWLSSEPANGQYYTEVYFELGPVYFCDERF